MTSKDNWPLALGPENATFYGKDSADMIKLGILK